MDLIKLCRLCLSAVNPQGETLFQRLPGNLIKDVLHKILRFRIKSTDTFIRICSKCESKLKVMYKTICQFQKSDQRFRVLLEEYKYSRKFDGTTPTDIAGSSDEELINQNMINETIPEIAMDIDEDVRIKIEKLDTYDEYISDEVDYSFLDPPSCSDVELYSGEEEAKEIEDANGNKAQCAAVADAQGADSLDSSIVNKCFICSEVQNNDTDLQKHLKGHRSLIPYVCSVCSIQFNDIGEANLHGRMHQFPFGCLYCEQIFSEESEFEQHKLSCNGYRCINCLESYRTVDEFKSHKCAKVTSVRALNRFFIRLNTRQRKTTQKTCPVCEKTFKRNEKFAQHLVSEHENLPAPLASCDYCTMSFTTLESARRHRLTHKVAPLVRKPQNALSFVSKDTTCWICSTRFIRDTQLAEHVKSEHPEHALSIVKCEQCPKHFTSVRKMEIHVGKVHKKGQETEYCCTYCGKKFKRGQTLQDHENTHLGLSTYRCDTCRKDFAFKVQYVRHIRSVHSKDAEKEHKCDICGKIYFDPVSLQNHMPTHPARLYKGCISRQKRTVTG